MLIKYSLYNDADSKRWDDFIESHSAGSPFHLSAWMRTIYETYHFKPLLYVSENENGKINGVFPCFIVKLLFRGIRIISNPFSDYCGPLFEDDRIGKELFDQIIADNGHRIKFIEIRNSLPGYIPCSSNNYYKLHVIELDSDPAEVFNKFNKKTIQYSMRKAGKNGIKIVKENSIRGIEEFYRLNMLTRKKHGVPCQPKQFFVNLFNQIISKGKGFILLAHDNSRVIAGGIFLKSNETIYYKYNASDPEYLIKKTPNHLLTWVAIKQSIESGNRKFDFGRTSISNEGLIRYKEMWGARAYDLPYSYYPDNCSRRGNSDDNLKYKIFTYVWKIMPDVIIEKVGTRLFKYMC